MNRKIKEGIIGGAFLWIVFWGMAADSPGDAGLIAAGLAMLGAVVLGVMLLNDKRHSDVNRKRKN